MLYKSKKCTFAAFKNIKRKMKHSVKLLLFLLLVSNLCAAKAQQTGVYTLPNIDVDTAAYPALRVLRQLHSHEKEDRFADLQVLDIYAEGDYQWEFQSSKFIKGYLRGVLSALGFPRLAKLIIGNELLTCGFNAHMRYADRKLRAVDVHLDSANIDLTQKQYNLLKRDVFYIDNLLMPQYCHPKSAWGSKRYERYQWLLVDSTSMDGHKVDILEFKSRPSNRLMEKMRGEVKGRIWVIEDYWRIVGLEWQNDENQSQFTTHLQQVAPGVFLPSEVSLVQDMSMTLNSMAKMLDSNLDSISDSRRQKLEKKIGSAGVTMRERYDFRCSFSLNNLVK